MDFLVKIERFQIKPNVINLKSTLVQVGVLKSLHCMIDRLNDDAID